MKADYHVHTYYSDDSETPMEDQIRRALEIKLDEICFTEHVDYGVKTDLNCNYEKYFDELHEMQEKYRGKITIRVGIEFGVQNHTVDLFERDFKKYDFDFVILSNHQVGDKEFWTGEYQEGKTQPEIHKAYYDAILEVAQKYKDYCVLGHLDMIKRYDDFGDYPDDNIIETVEQILKQAISDGKGIELNTSCFKYGLKDLTPSRRILKLYRDLGGEILTIGSDTHETKHLADRFDDAKNELKNIGFKSFCTFEKMKPIFHDL